MIPLKQVYTLETTRNVIYSHEWIRGHSRELFDNSDTTRGCIATTETTPNK